MKKLIFIIIAMMLIACTPPSVENVEITIHDSLNLRVYTPSFSRLDLRCARMPSIEERDVIFVAEAAFTEALLDTFAHTNIDGNHVSGGVWYEGASCPETRVRIGNTGGFVWYEGSYQFFGDTLSAEQGLLEASKHGGMGFMQEIIIHRGRYMSNTRTENPRFNRTENYRLLAELDGRLCIVENIEPSLFSEFLTAFQRLNPTEALYLDMGEGWNHSWYRLSSGATEEIYPAASKSRYCTNWLTFYK